MDHRLKPKKLLDIIALSEKILLLEDLKIEVEYQGVTQLVNMDWISMEKILCWFQLKQIVWLKTNVASRRKS